MSPGNRRRVRNAVLALALLTLAAWQAPVFFSAERYRGRLEAGLARVLQRPVTFSQASWRLLPRPGFSLRNVVVREDPAFGSEPFARIDRVECDIRWRSLWASRLEFSRLRLVRPSLNIVRDAQGEWNVENLLLKSGLVPTAGAPRARPGRVATLSLDAEEGRLDFKVGADKKPFAVVDLSAHLSVDPTRGLIRYRVAGNPLRTDLPLAPPGLLELAGEWRPGSDLGGSLEATLETRGALLYNWVPLVTGRNPGIYGVFDANVKLSGSLRVIRVDGEARLTQLHRWDLLPPADPMPWAIHFRGEFDRTRGQASVDSLEAVFGDSRVHLSGAVHQIPGSPQLDMVVALERARLEDLVAVSRRLWGHPATVDLSGRMDGLVSVRGPWTARRYAGFVGAREVRISTPSGTFPVSEVALRIDDQGVRLAPVRLTLAPRVVLGVEGALRRSAPQGSKRPNGRSPRYELTVSAKSLPLHDLVRFGRAVGFRSVQGLDAEGIGSATFQLSGTAWPFVRPSLSGSAELRAARLLIPGLTEPLNLPRAHILVKGDHITVDPLVAVMGTSVFTARLEHRGERSNPWQFKVKADSLALEQGALWFDVLGHRPPLPLLERIPGLSSFRARRVVAASLFSALKARGEFESPSLQYRDLHLDHFRAGVEISGRVIRVKDASFRLGGGSSNGNAQVDLTGSPARLTGDVTLAGARLQTLASRLPPALHKAQAMISGTAHFETRGLTRQEMGANLNALARVQLRNASFGDFDPLQALAQQAHWGRLEPVHRPVALPAILIPLQITGSRVLLSEFPLVLEGARLTLTGSYGFDGNLDLTVHSDFRHLTRGWANVEGEERPAPRMAGLHLSGALDRLVAAPEVQVTQAIR
jgi:hypothetical protein